MNKSWFILFSILLFAGCSKVQKDYTPGIYIGTAQGYLNTMEVAVTVDEHYITAIELIQSDDPEILLKPVMEELPKKVIKKNGTDVQGVSGATYTSESLLKAIDLALEQARIQE